MNRLVRQLARETAASSVGGTDTLPVVQSGVAKKATIAQTRASPTFTGVPAAPTASPGTSTTQIATTAFVTTADDLKAPLASPTFTGTVTLPTAVAGLNGLGNYADDAAAAVGGVAVGRLYRNGSILMCRIA